MITHFGCICLAKCFSIQGTHREFTEGTNDYHDGLYLENFGVSKNEAPALPGFKNISYESLPYTNFQEGYNIFALPDEPNVNNSYADTSGCYTNSIVGFQEDSLNPMNQFYTQLPAYEYTTYQCQSNDNLFQCYNPNNEENIRNELNKHQKEYKGYNSPYIDESKDSNLIIGESTFFTKNVTTTDNNEIGDKKNTSLNSCRLLTLSQPLDNDINISETKDNLSEEEFSYQVESRLSGRIKESKQNFRAVLNDLKRIRLCERRFFDLKIADESISSTLCADLKKLKEIAEHTQEICRKWIKEEESDMNSNLNSDEKTNQYKFVYKVKNKIFYFEKFIKQIDFRSIPENFNRRNKILKKGIEKIEVELESFKPFGSNKIFEGINYVKRNNDRNLIFSFQNHNDINIQYFYIPLQKEFHPTFLSIFEDYAFVCIYRSDQHLKILKIDLKTQMPQVLIEYKVEEKNRIKYAKFGHGSRYTIIRNDSKGNLVLLKSPIKRSVSDKNFELLVLNKEFERLASIEINSLGINRKSLRPAIVDFVIHNDLVYALDMKSKCINIFNGSLKHLKAINIPESLNEKKDIHLAISSNYIFISFGTTIYYIKNNTTEFKSLELDDCVFNIACYDENYLIVGFVDKSLLIKIEDNSISINKFCLSFLEQFKGLNLTAFTINGKFLYFLCKHTYQVFRFKLTLDQNNKLYQ